MVIGQVFRDVGAADPNDLGLRDVGPGIGGPVDSERLFVAGGHFDHAKSAVVVDVGGLQANAGELAHQVSFSVVRLAVSMANAEGPCWVWMRTDVFSDQTNGLVVGGSRKPFGDAGSRR